MSEENKTTQTDLAEEKKEVKKEPVVAVEEKKEEIAEEGEEVEVPAKFKSLVEAVESMSVLELHELVKLLEKKFGVSAAAVAVAPQGSSAGGSAEEKSTFTVELSDAGAQKIAVIKVVKEVFSLGLKEAKDLVDAAPAVLKEGMKKEEAEELQKRIQEAGGKITLK